MAADVEVVYCGIWAVYACVWRILLNTDTVLVTWALYMKITLQINQTWIEVFKGVLSAKHFMYFLFFIFFWNQDF